MRLWQLPARALPVTLRPLGGETVISYTRRLSEANGLAPTAIMRALGQVIPGSGYHLLDHDAWLNDQAIARLEALSALPRHRLATALPALRWGPPRWFPPLPEDSPPCAATAPGRPPGRPAGHARCAPLAAPPPRPWSGRRHHRCFAAVTCDGSAAPPRPRRPTSPPPPRSSPRTGATSSS